MVTAIHDQNFGEALAERARRASTRRLSLDIFLGLLAFVIFAVWRPQDWGIPACASLCFAMFGIWGATDRSLESPNRITPVGNNAIVGGLLIIKTIALCVGTGAALVVLFGVLGVSMGTWTH